jgi:hypothetical protein
MHDLQRSYNVMTMISPIKNQDFGIPAPIVELTMEQQFKLKQIENALRHPESKKEDIITIFLALQRQCFRAWQLNVQPS